MLRPCRRRDDETRRLPTLPAVEDDPVCPGLLEQKIYVAVRLHERRDVECDPVARRRGFSRRLLGVDLTAGLATVDVPVAVLAGAVDRVLPVAESELIASRVPGATLLVFAGAGHMLPLERAAEVAATIAEMASDGPGGTD